MTGHAALARANFETGCNCAQAVLCAYPELLPRETAMKLGASLGGGIGRLREVCGAVSAMVLLAGLLYADTDIPTHERKQAHYARVQELAHRFQTAHGSYLCRDLLAGVETTPCGPPARRRAELPGGALFYRGCFFIWAQRRGYFPGVGPLLGIRTAEWTISVPGIR